jgi:hypothetical protein
MHHYVIYIARIDGNQQFLEGKVELCHLVAPLIVQESPSCLPLVGMALHGLQSTEGLKHRCDLINMGLVPPDPVAEAIHKLEGEP